MVGQAIDMSQFADVIKQIGDDIIRTDITGALYPKVRMVLVSATKKCFHNGTSPDGIPHLPLKHQRVRGGGTPVPLRDTGELMASVTANGPGHIDRREGNWIVFGTAHVKAWHNDGGEIKAVRAKFLCIPVTLEAFYAGSPRNFPGKLFFLWNDETKKGVAIGIAVDYRKQGRQRETYKNRVKKIKSLMRQPARLSSGVKVTSRAKFKVMSLSSWMKLATKQGRKAARGTIGRFMGKFLKKLKKLLSGRKKKRKPGSKGSAMRPVRKSKPGERRIHYILKDKVFVPARPFIGISDETADKLELIAADHMMKSIEDRFYGNNP